MQQRLELLGQFGIVPVERVKDTVARDAARIPEARNLRLALPGKRKNAAGLKLVHPAINGMRRWDVIVAHERSYRIAIDFGVPAGMSA